MIVNILTIITAFDCRPAGGKHSIVSLSSIIRLKRFVNQARERERGRRATRGKRVETQRQTNRSTGS